MTTQQDPDYDCPTGEPIFDPEYWYKRLANSSPADMHHAVFRCPRDRWERIANKHRHILLGRVGPRESLLDAGCGWGRLLDLLPSSWNGYYCGIDLCPDFAGIARQRYPQHAFICGDLRGVEPLWFSRCREGYDEFDWCILVSIRPMIKRHCGEEVWDKIERRLRSVSKRLLYLEYDENDPGEVVECL